MATSHYLSQCWPSSSMSPYDATKPQWVNLATTWQQAITWSNVHGHVANWYFETVYKCTGVCSVRDTSRIHDTHAWNQTTECQKKIRAWFGVDIGLWVIVVRRKPNKEQRYQWVHDFPNPLEQGLFNSWRRWRQKQVSQSGISNCIPQNTVGCNYLSQPEIPVSGTKGLNCISKTYLKMIQIEQEHLLMATTWWPRTVDATASIVHAAVGRGPGSRVKPMEQWLISASYYRLHIFPMQMKFKCQSCQF